MKIKGVVGILLLFAAPLFSDDTLSYDAWDDGWARVYYNGPT